MYDLENETCHYLIVQKLSNSLSVRREKLRWLCKDCDFVIIDACLDSERCEGSYWRRNIDNEAKILSDSVSCFARRKWWTLNFQYLNNFNTCLMQLFTIIFDAIAIKYYCQMRIKFDHYVSSMFRRPVCVENHCFYRDHVGMTVVMDTKWSQWNLTSHMIFNWSNVFSEKESS